MVAFPPAKRERTGLPDPVDRLSGRPDFAIFIYPGQLVVPASVPSNAPPAFRGRIRRPMLRRADG